MDKYAKIVKLVMWVLLAIGVGIIVWAAVAGLPQSVSDASTNIDVILYWAYALVAVAVLAIVVLGLYTTAAQKGIKGILKLLGVIAVACALVAGSWLLAKSQTANGAPIVLANGSTPEVGDLMITNTVLNLTYLLCGAAVATILFSAIFTAVRK